MAVADKTGRMHHSAGRARLQDEMDAQSSASKSGGGDGAPAKKGMDSKKDGADKGGEGKTDVSNMEMSEVVKKHGPAHHIVMHHDDENAVHSVTSHHGKSGHMAHHEFASREDAHEHAAKASGVGNENPDEETPGQEMNESEEADNEPDKNAIPGMAQQSSYGD
jgi:hypothetical protein